MTYKENITAILECCFAGFNEEIIDSACNRILGIEQETRWIPVTEDVPPKGTVCLWCNKQGSIFVSEITNCLERISYVGKHGHFSNGLENYGNIVAWMPLPKAYKEGK